MRNRNMSRLKHRNTDLSKTSTQWTKSTRVNLKSHTATEVDFESGWTSCDGPLISRLFHIKLNPPSLAPGHFLVS